MQHLHAQVVQGDRVMLWHNHAFRAGAHNVILTKPLGHPKILDPDRGSLRTHDGLTLREATAARAL